MRISITRRVGFYCDQKHWYDSWTLTLTSKRKYLKNTDIVLNIWCLRRIQITLKTPSSDIISFFLKCISTVCVRNIFKKYSYPSLITPCNCIHNDCKQTDSGPHVYWNSRVIAFPNIFFKTLLPNTVCELVAGRLASPPPWTDALTGFDFCTRFLAPANNPYDRHVD